MAREFAAVLIDFENVFYFLKNQVFTDGREITEVVVEMIRSLNTHLLKEFGEAVISMDAYADFDRIDENAQSELYLLGVETHNVLGTDTKNAADMKLCIDTLDILYNRDEIRSFIFVAGDRDYIPVIQYLKKRGRMVRVVGFPKSTSGDLVEIVGQENFIHASQFIPPMKREPIKKAITNGTAGIAVTLASKPPTVLSSVPAVPAWPSVENEFAVDLEKYDAIALEVAIKDFQGRQEIWLTPYLHKLRAWMPELTEPQRKRIVGRLEQQGAFRVEKRKGEPHDYSIIKINWNDPLIREVNPGA